MESMQGADDIECFRRAIERLSRDLGPEGLAEILDSYLTDTRTRMDSLPGLLEAGDHPAMARCVHSIRGGSAIFGLQELERASLAVESALKRSETRGLAPLVDALRDRYRAWEPLLRAEPGGSVRRDPGRSKTPEGSP